MPASHAPSSPPPPNTNAVHAIAHLQLLEVPMRVAGTRYLRSVPGACVTHQGGGGGDCPSPLPDARSAGAVPPDGLLYRVAVLGELKAAEGGVEFAGVDHERRPELVGRLTHLPKQRGERARDREQHRAGDAGVDWHRPSGGPCDHVEELLRGEWLGRWQVPDLPVGFVVIGEDQQTAGDVGQELEGVRLVEPPCPLRLLPGQDPPEHRLSGSRASAMRPVIVRGSTDRDPCPAVAVRAEELGGHFDPDPALTAVRKGRQVLAQRSVNRAVRVKVVSENQLGATGLGGTQDGTGQRGEQLRPLGISRTRAVIKDGRAHRRGGRFGRVGRIGSHALRSLRRPPTAADRPHTPAGMHQLADHGTADATGRAEDYVQGTARLRHRSTSRSWFTSSAATQSSRYFAKSALINLSRRSAATADLRGRAEAPGRGTGARPGSGWRDLARPHWFRHHRQRARRSHPTLVTPVEASQVPTTLAAIRVWLGGSQSSMLSAWARARRAASEAGLGAAVYCLSSSVTIMTSKR